MKKLIVLSIPFLLSSVFIINAGAQELTEKQAESITKEVNPVFREMLTFAEKLDYEKLNAGVDDTHKAGFIAAKKYYSQYSTLIDEMKSNTQDIVRQDFSIKEKKVTVLSDKIVLITVAGIAVVSLDEGREITINFHWSFVFEKIDNNWKVIHSHQSTTG